MKIETQSVAPQYVGPNLSNDSRDGDIALTALILLQASAYPAVRTLRCEHRDGVLVLRGCVSSYRDKQMAQEAVRNLGRVIFNAVEVVVRPEGSAG